VLKTYFFYFSISNSWQRAYWQPGRATEGCRLPPAEEAPWITRPRECGAVAGHLQGVPPSLCCPWGRCAAPMISSNMLWAHDLCPAGETFHLLFHTRHTDLARHWMGVWKHMILRSFHYWLWFDPESFLLYIMLWSSRFLALKWFRFVWVEFSCPMFMIFWHKFMAISWLLFGDVLNYFFSIELLKKNWKKNQ
jgi:hypothetical protein